MTKHVVTAFDANKGYRCTISKPISLDEANTFKDRTERDMSVSIPRYQWARDVRVEARA